MEINPLYREDSRQSLYMLSVPEIVKACTTSKTMAKKCNANFWRTYWERKPQSFTERSRWIYLLALKSQNDKYNHSFLKGTLEAGINVDYANDDTGDNIMLQCVANNHFKLTEYLIKKGATFTMYDLFDIFVNKPKLFNMILPYMRLEQVDELNVDTEMMLEIDTHSDKLSDFLTQIFTKIQHTQYENLIQEILSNIFSIYLESNMKDCSYVVNIAIKLASFINPYPNVKEIIRQIVDTRDDCDSEEITQLYNVLSM